MRIRTLDQLIETLNNDLRWRKRELSNLQAMLQGRKAHKTLILRAAICILYAHWEGFVKMAATSYVAYVANLSMRYRDLTPNFVALGLRQEIREAGQSNLPTIHTILTERLMSDLSDKAEINWQNSVNTGSNLNAKALKEILTLLGLDSSNYLTKGQLLDRKLLGNRNRVAHGEQSEVDSDDYDLLHAEVIQLVERFNTDVQNAATTEQFRR